MNSVEAGAAIAVLVAGWPLYRLVTDGDLDAGTALFRWGVVAAVCAYGVALILRLMSRWEAEAEAERQRRLDELYTDMEQAVTDGRLTADGVTDHPDDEATGQEAGAGSQDAAPPSGR